METVSNATTEQTALTGEKQDDSDDEDEGNIDLGVAGLPQVNFSGLKNEFQTINLDGDGDDEEEDEPSDRDLSDDKRKKKYRKKKKKNQPSENSSDSSSDDDRRSSRKKKETDIDPSDLTWPLWVWYYIVAVSSGALKDYWTKPWRWRACMLKVAPCMVGRTVVWSQVQIFLA
ncbi:hypothetical protein pdam_00023870 [Pocillopora damicornis]|uniref:Uncharacterized protein n=1 Tax=Pocillopora damicornis TaxID=46731 RepID=A0A3M6TI39_POCDA|nr:hypothetical protein pdam_00023870 [Pocillopora damicornis]